ncbi:MAG: DUF308 domain-containing protein [Lachnospiraceae bacterium]|nr:DUF308 domain-containing protein [Lachnospiraceae bacterium]
MGNLLKRLKTNIVISAILCVVLGIVLVVWPDLSRQIVCIAIGAVLLISGGVRLAVYFTNKDGSMYAQMSLIAGIVLAVVGVWILMKPDKVLAIIPIIVGIVIVLHGINDLQQAVSLCKDKYDKWWVALVLGLLTIGFGVLLICRPFEALDTVVMMIGLFLIYDGLSDIWIVSRIYRTAKVLKQEAEALDVVAKEIK